MNGYSRVLSESFGGMKKYPPFIPLFSTNRGFNRGFYIGAIPY
jgi:hypothetical protein